MSVSWKPEVQVMGEAPDSWHGNALRFATYQEAMDNARDLMGRWTLVKDYRAVESDDPVNYRWDDNTRSLIDVIEETV